MNKYAIMYSTNVWHQISRMNLETVILSVRINLSTCMWRSLCLPCCSFIQRFVFISLSILYLCFAICRLSTTISRSCKFFSIAMIIVCDIQMCLNVFFFLLLSLCLSWFSLHETKKSIFVARLMLNEFCERCLTFICAFVRECEHEATYIFRIKESKMSQTTKPEQRKPAQNVLNRFYKWSSNET